ncbi:AAA domain-containing protein [Seinonella peptonophila]|uniref:AAA domain-containing protein n=1 Tax=Seinonella peptonophila TaxID=112248 RepID=A0A1M5AY71_9BACL|nr:AAA family ATPase [Seinonella peptonophila]SHF35159.1 AAA domain-containing protein [Seinonella peptonophila]
MVEHLANQYDVLIIDPITNIYQKMKDVAWEDAEQRAKRKGKSPDEANLTQCDWGKIKQKFASLISQLSNLPCHLIVTGWQKDIYDEKSMKIIGTRIDADKKTNHLGDIVIKLERDHYGNRFGVIDKDRTQTFREGQRVKNPSFDQFLPVLEDGKVLTIPESTYDQYRDIYIMGSKKGLNNGKVLTIPESTYDQYRDIYIMGSKKGLNSDQVKEFASKIFDFTVDSLKQLNATAAEKLKYEIEKLELVGQ